MCYVFGGLKVTRFLLISCAFTLDLKVASRDPLRADVACFTERNKVVGIITRSWNSLQYLFIYHLVSTKDFTNILSPVAARVELPEQGSKHQVSSSKRN